MSNQRGGKPVDPPTQALQNNCLVEVHQTVSQLYFCECDLLLSEKRTIIMVLSKSVDQTAYKAESAIHFEWRNFSLINSCCVGAPVDQEHSGGPDKALLMP